MKKSTLKRLIQIPLQFHHQDIHEQLELVKQELAEIKTLLLTLKDET